MATVKQHTRRTKSGVVSVRQYTRSNILQGRRISAALDRLPGTGFEKLKTASAKRLLRLSRANAAALEMKRFQGSNRLGGSTVVAGGRRFSGRYW